MKKENEEKTIIPRAEDARAAKANEIMRFNFIARILYLLDSYRIKGDINYAIKHRASYIFLDPGEKI